MGEPQFYVRALVDYTAPNTDDGLSFRVGDVIGVTGQSDFHPQDWWYGFVCGPEAAFVGDFPVRDPASGRPTFELHEGDVEYELETEQPEPEPGDVEPEPELDAFEEPEALEGPPEEHHWAPLERELAADRKAGRILSGVDPCPGRRAHAHRHTEVSSAGGARGVWLWCGTY